MVKHLKGTVGIDQAPQNLKQEPAIVKQESIERPTRRIIDDLTDQEIVTELGAGVRFGQFTGDFSEDKVEAIEIKQPVTIVIPKLTDGMDENPGPSIKHDAKKSRSSATTISSEEEIKRENFVATNKELFVVDRIIDHYESKESIWHSHAYKYLVRVLNRKQILL